MPILNELARVVGCGPKQLARLLTTWGVCAAAVALHVGILQTLARHAGPGADWRDGLGVVVLPYVLIALAALVVHRFEFASKTLLVGAFLAALPDLFCDAAGMPAMIEYLDDLAAGQEVMFCGPPPPLVGLFVAGLIAVPCVALAFLSAVVNLLWPGTPTKAAPSAWEKLGPEEP